MKKFDNELIMVKNELLALKTQYAKKMGQLRTKEYTVPIRFELEKYASSPYYTTIQSTKRAEISFDVQGDEKGLVSYRIDIDNVDGREYISWIDFFGTDIVELNGKISIRINNSTNQNDIDMLDNGQTPVINLNIIITSTSELTTEVEYV